MSGFVGTIYHSVCPSDNSTIFLKAKITPSKRINDDYHKVWVCVKKSSSAFAIVTSWCTCIAGSAEACNHVIALLYKVNHAYHQNFISPACTSIPQGWNKGTKKEIQPSKVADVHFRKDKKTKATGEADESTGETIQRKDFDPRHPLHRTLTNE